MQTPHSSSPVIPELHAPMLEGLRDEFNQKLRAVSTSLFAALRREEDARLDAERSSSERIEQAVLKVLNQTQLSLHPPQPSESSSSALQIHELRGRTNRLIDANEDLKHRVAFLEQKLTERTADFDFYDRLDQVRQEALKVPSSTQKQVRELDARVHQLEQRLMVTALASDAVRREDHVHLAERLRRLAEATAQLRDEVENQGVTLKSTRDAADQQRIALQEELDSCSQRWMSRSDELADRLDSTSVTLQRCTSGLDDVMQLAEQVQSTTNQNAADNSLLQETIVTAKHTIEEVQQRQHRIMNVLTELRRDVQVELSSSGAVGRTAAAVVDVEAHVRQLRTQIAKVCDMVADMSTSQRSAADSVAAQVLAQASSAASSLTAATRSTLAGAAFTSPASTQGTYSSVAEGYHTKSPGRVTWVEAGDGSRAAMPRTSGDASNHFVRPAESTQPNPSTHSHGDIDDLLSELTSASMATTRLPPSASRSATRHRRTSPSRRRMETATMPQQKLNASMLSAQATSLEPGVLLFDSGSDDERDAGRQRPPRRHSPSHRAPQGAESHADRSHLQNDIVGLAGRPRRMTALSAAANGEEHIWGAGGSTRGSRLSSMSQLESDADVQ